MGLNMKVLKGIFFSIVALIIASCIGILVCALSPGLTAMLAEKVENMTQAKSEGEGGRAGRNESAGWEGILGILSEGVLPSDKEQPENGSSGSETPEGQTELTVSGDGNSSDSQSPSEIQPGVSTDWMEEDGRASYELPGEQNVEAPESVSDRMGYEPVQEGAEQIPEDEADELPENAPLGNTGEGLAFDGELYPYYAMLEEDMRRLYAQIYANAMELGRTFSPVVTVNVDQLRTVFEAVYNDHPELFWLETGYSCKYLKNGKCVEITLKYNATAENLDTARADFEAAAGSILSGVENLGSSREKERQVHDSLMEMAEYVLDAPMNQSAYSALVEGRSVCAGYARAFQYLMQQLGIPCYYCTGFAGEDHAWNIIKLDGNYYNVDVTWDDTDPATYDFFNKSDQEFASSHRRTGLAVYLPACLAEGTSGNDSGAGQAQNAETDIGEGADQQGTPETGNPDSGEQSPEETPLINPDPAEPLTWQSKTVTDPEGTEAERRRENLEEAGITEEEVRETLREYYEDCEKQLKELGTGEGQFTNVIPETLWDAIERAYNNEDYREGYVDGALEDMDAEYFWIHLQVERIGGGYCRLYHSVYTY